VGFLPGRSAVKGDPAAIPGSQDSHRGKGGTLKASTRMDIKHIPVDSGREPGTPAGAELPIPGPEASPGPWHSVTVSSSAPDVLEDNGPLERSLRELVRYYRHSSVGRHCLGIVHQMNTPLQVLAFQLDLLNQKAQEELSLLSAPPLADTGPLVTLNHYRQAKFSQLHRELQRLQDITRSLVLQGVHEEPREKYPLDLNQLYRNELELYQAQAFFKHQVTGEFHFQDALPLFPGHYIDFSQSFRNLVDNSLEAMAGTDRRLLTVVTACRRRRIILRIGDTGVGIPPADLPRIFQPFFTTRQTPGGDRAGLGLFMVPRLLAPYQAEIRVDSNSGGTWVTLSFPVA
jgi:two-component system, NtrC family, sensor kinase